MSERKFLEIKQMIYGIGAWKVGEIKDTPYMQEAYEMGKMV